MECFVPPIFRDRWDGLGPYLTLWDSPHCMPGGHSLDVNWLGGSIASYVAGFRLKLTSHMVHFKSYRSRALTLWETSSIMCKHNLRYTLTFLPNLRADLLTRPPSPQPGLCAVFYIPYLLIWFLFWGVFQPLTFWTLPGVAG